MLPYVIGGAAALGALMLGSNVVKRRRKHDPRTAATQRLKIIDSRHAVTRRMAAVNPRRKMKDEWTVQGNYGYGWDDEYSSDDRADARARLKEYQANGGGSYRFIKRRVPIEAANPESLSPARREGRIRNIQICKKHAAWHRERAKMWLKENRKDLASHHEKEAVEDDAEAQRLEKTLHENPPKSRRGKKGKWVSPGSAAARLAHWRWHHNPGGLPPKPKVGQRMTVRGVECRITKIQSYGTVDVVSLDGKNAWRVTGLGWRK
jgi:hypothetical protein